MTREEEILKRLAGVADGRAWRYNPKHEMFIGSTHAVEMRSRTLDLGRAGNEWEPSKDPSIKGYVLTENARRTLTEVRALGEFLASCREDMEYLLARSTHTAEGR